MSKNIGASKNDAIGVLPRSPAVPVESYPLLQFYVWGLRITAAISGLVSFALFLAVLDRQDGLTGDAIVFGAVGMTILQLLLAEIIRAFINLVQTTQRNNHELQRVAELLSGRASEERQQP